VFLSPPSSLLIFFSELFPALGARDLQLKMFTLVVIGILLAPIANAAGSNVLCFRNTPNGFNAPPRGWNSFGLQALSPPLVLEQQSIITQCDALADKLGKYGYEYCSLDSGWSVGDHGDENGRIDYDHSKFDIPALATHLHSKKLKLGVYILPGYFSKDKDKTIHGTNPPIKLSDAGTGECDSLARCAFDYSAPGVQEYCNSVVDQFASW
jgi:alpha-galactosidase